MLTRAKGNAQDVDTSPGQQSSLFWGPPRPERAPEGRGSQECRLSLLCPRELHSKEQATSETLPLHF